MGPCVTRWAAPWLRVRGCAERRDPPCELAGVSSWFLVRLEGTLVRVARGRRSRLPQSLGLGIRNAPNRHSREIAPCALSVKDSQPGLGYRTEWRRLWCASRSVHVGPRQKSPSALSRDTPNTALKLPDLRSTPFQLTEGTIQSGERIAFQLRVPIDSGPLLATVLADSFRSMSSFCAPLLDKSANSVAPLSWA